MCRFTAVELDPRFRLILRRELPPQIFNRGNNGCECCRDFSLVHLSVKIIFFFTGAFCYQIEIKLGVCVYSENDSAVKTRKIMSETKIHYSFHQIA